LENVKSSSKACKEIKYRSKKTKKVVEEQDFRREKLLEKYIVKMLYRWNDKKFEEKYLKKLERNW